MVLSNVAGNLFLSRGLRHGEPLAGASPLAYLAAFLNPWVVVGVCLLIFWMLARMAFLSWADLSYILLVTSLGYVLAALAGKFFLAEQVPASRWAGVGFIVAGVTLAGLTDPASQGRRR